MASTVPKKRATSRKAAKGSDEVELICSADPAVKEIAAQTKGLSESARGPATPDQVQDFSPADLAVIPPRFKLAKVALPPNSTATHSAVKDPIVRILTDIPSEERAALDAEADPAKRFARALRELPEDVEPGSLQLDAEGKLLEHYLEFNGFTMPFIEAYNYWITHRLPRQIASKKKVFPDGTVLSFANPFFTQPSTLLNAADQEVAGNGQTAKALLPKQCRDDDLTYNMPMFAEAVLTSAGGTEVREKNIFCGKIPVMLGSIACHLHGRTDRERYELGECSEDPLGYFIIKGNERVILFQDKLRKNCIYVMDGGKSDPLICTITTSTLSSSSKLTIALQKQTRAMRLRLFALLGKDAEGKTREMPVFIAFRLLGVENIDEIVAMVMQFTRPEYRNKVFMALIPSIAQIKDIPDDIAYIARVRGTATLDVRTNTLSITKDLRSGLFPHMSRRDDGTEASSREIDRNKLMLLAMMICRFAEVLANVRPLDDRDDWANKRCEGAATSMEQLFDTLWSRFAENLFTTLSATYEKELSKNAGIANASVMQVALRAALKTAAMSPSRRHIITDDFIDSFTGDKWGARNAKGMSNYTTGVTEMLRRESVLSTMSQLTRIRTQSSEKNKDVNIRFIHFSQNRYLCIVDTPEGSTCGLRKALGITSHPAIERDDRPIIAALADMLSSVKTSSRGSPCLVNGKFLGFVDGAQALAVVVGGRRRGLFPRDISVLHDTHSSDQAFYVFTESSRLVAPLLVVNPETGRLLVDDLQLRGESFETLFARGCVEYISAVEERGLLVAPTKNELEKRLETIKTVTARVEQLERDAAADAAELQDAREELERIVRKRPYTHCEIDPTAQFGVAAAAIPLANHNQAPRNVFQCLAGGTRVSVSLRGTTRPIEELRNGDNVVTFDTSRQRLSLTRVANFFAIEPRERLLRVTTEGGESITLTDDHRLWTARIERGIPHSERMREARELVPTHTAIARIGENGMYFSTVVSVEVVPRELVYDFETLSENHTFIADGFVSSNCSMGRQALGIFSSRHANRFDSSVKMLAWPNAPIFEPQINRIIGLDKLPQGQMVRALMATYDGNGIEDSHIISQGAIDRGLCQRVKYSSFKIIEQHDTNYNDSILNPVTSTTLANYRHDSNRSLHAKAMRNPDPYKHLDERGIVRVGSVVSQYDCLIGMARVITRKGETASEEDMSLYVPIHEWGTVTRVHIATNSENNRLIKVKIARVTRPEKGDKFAPRNAQKGTIGAILPEDEMPYDENGPFDIIIDPHSQPSRMTLEMPLEILGSMVGALRGHTINATSFRKFDIDEYARALIHYGFNPYSTSTVYDGRTGRPMSGTAFSGMIHLQALRHIVEDKIQAVANAPIEPVYRQPVGGRSAGGATRMGEMERDALLSHGASKLVQESMCLRSDAYEALYCTNCGTIAIEDRIAAERRCRSCKERASFARATIPYVFKTLTQQLAGAGIYVRVSLSDPDKLNGEMDVAAERDDVALARMAALKSGDDAADDIQNASDEEELEELDELEEDDFGDDGGDDGYADEY